MKKSTHLITEAELHAYVDGHLDDTRRIQVEAYLDEHPEEASRVHAYQRQNQELRALFDPVLNQPSLSSGRRHSPLVAPRALRYVAMFLLILTSGLFGWWLHGDQRPLLQAQSFPHEAAIAHTVYVPEVRHPVEVGADQEAHLTAWLSKRLGASVRAPHLGSVGYELVGGRLLPGDKGPAAQFMYQDVRGQRLTLYVRTAIPDNSESAFRYAREDKVSVFYWIDGPFAYALSGEISKDELLHVANEIYRAINPG